VLQSHLPEHYALVHACAQDFPAFYERETEFRRTMAYPPFVALANVIVRSNDGGRARGEALALARVLREHAAGRFRVLGPAAAPLARIAGEHRYQVLLKGLRAVMREALRAALSGRYGPVRWPGVAVDVDPLTLM
jgi:primosomal protein N' (replication factor Y)